MSLTLPISVHISPFQELGRKWAVAAEPDNCGPELHPVWGVPTSATDKAWELSAPSPTESEGEPHSHPRKSEESSSRAEVLHQGGTSESPENFNEIPDSRAPHAPLYPPPPLAQLNSEANRGSLRV